MSQDVPVDSAVEVAERGGMGRPDARHVAPRAHERQRRVHGGRRRPRPRRSSAASRASSRFSTRSSTSPPRGTSRTRARSSATSTRPAARRRAGSWAARRRCRCASPPSSARARGAERARAADRPDLDRRDRRRATRFTVTRQARDRRDPAGARRADLLRPPLPPLRDQLTQHMPQGTLMKFEAVYDTAVLARQGPERPGRERERAREGHVRHLAAERQPRDHDGLHRRPRCPRSGRTRSADERRAGGAPELRELLRERGAQPARRRRVQLVDRGLEPRAARRRARARHPDRLRRGAARRRSAASTGPARRPRRTGTATWTARSARASVPRARCWPPFSPVFVRVSRLVRPDWGAARRCRLPNIGPGWSAEQGRSRRRGGGGAP